MRKRRGNSQFNESALLNNITYMQYFNRLKDLAISMFEWQNLPPTVDPRYIELHLFQNGSMVYFNDDVVGNLCLDCMPNGNFDVYGNPVNRRAYSSYNNYQRDLNEDNSIIIWNNYLRTNSITDIKLYSKRLYLLDRIIDVNANAQKTPVLVLGTEKQRLTLLNLYKEYDGNEPFIFGDKNLDLNGLKSLNTGAPYVADKIYQLKTQIWNDALSYLGISNINIQKKERLITDEVTKNQAETIASRYSRLQARREAVDKINAMFGTNIRVYYRKDFQKTDGDDGYDTTKGGDNDD